MTLQQQVCSTRTSWNKGKRGYHMPSRGGGYDAVHKWLNKHWGKAGMCESKKCLNKSKVFYWAKKKGKEYAHIRSNFFQLCASCHRLYDQTPEWLEKVRLARVGTKLTKEHKEAISKSMKKTLSRKRYGAI